jgi:hypothetical protein
MDEVRLRETVRERLRTGGLPATSARTWGGAGKGSPCALCMSAITRDEMEFELELRQPTAPFAIFYHLHPRCYAAWELERSIARR